VVARANDTEYGLAASVYSQNFAKARAVGQRLRAGTVWINCYDTFDAALPFGGFKASGIGRELGEAGLQPYLETKTMVVNMAYEE
jgi:aldehyde dehydrogenase (NAD+)